MLSKPTHNAGFFDVGDLDDARRIILTPETGRTTDACNSCWNDPRLRFDHKDFLWCPRHKDTPRQFESTRLITVEQLKAVIGEIPGFRIQASPTTHLNTPESCAFRP